ncbi:hypothetical protein G3O08_14910 [Cryomorpha ignava]|uniref:Dockerin domain-containing protein n=1 Tax=Cryomorpha ignava TaxID=101383 RepID=A0A7K3WV51_9FLAO|nr:zinc-dependent metalloprotease family protein [Cryomorpha ignava]NEN24792.1 hypothetical protein [Cryomorpha ignava]
MTKFTLTAIFAFVLNLFLSAQAVIWNDIPDPKRETQQIYPESYRTMTVDFESLKSLLLAAPAEGTDLRTSNYTLQLPTADGGRAAFKIVEESVMAPELQARYPNIRTFVGLGTGDYANANISIDYTLKGFHAQILIEGKSYYIDPLSPGDLNTYIVYSRESFFKSNTKEMGSCEPEGIGVPHPGDDSPGQKPNNPVDIISPLTSNGTQLRTYDLALACTGEYAQFHGGTVPLVMSAMTTTMNRVNGIFRRDLCLRMILIANNDDIIFLNPLSDGYTNNSTSAMIDQNQIKTNAIIGSANYDIGHVLSTVNSGLATLGVVCDNSAKARGVSGQSSPVGDPFDVDFLAHEMGHQWGATHTQNNSCNRTSSSAFEPGSGSTIMGYAGICSPDLQSNSDAYFHNHSYNQMVSYSVAGAGNACATITSASNLPPVVSFPSGGFSIPKSTPFELTAFATDPNNDAMTYCWEQFDLGSATASGDNNLTNPSGDAPIFRSWSPTSSPTRVFPRLSDLVNNTTVIGERLPTYARDLTFKCTVRDNYINGAVNDAQIAFDVAGNSGPFVVNSPNTAVTWIVGANETISWNVANTTAAPVSCSTVNIYLSTDGGYTYPTLLIANTANDGLQTIVVPNLPTTQARIKVRAVGNIFFDISNQNFAISEDVAPPANDAICSAVTINCGDNLSGTTVEATPSSLGEPSCAGGTDNDVFYRLNAIEGNTYTITVNGDNYDGVLAIYSGATCGSTLTELACADNGFTSGVAETITFTAAENTPIFIQTYDWSSNAGEFNITLDCEFANDDPCDAQLVSCGETVSGSTTGATQSAVGIPSCGSGSQNDVFYKIEAIAGVDYTVTINGINYDGVLAAYTGNCSGTLTELDCSDSGIGTNLIETINFSVGFNQTVYIQTYDWFSSGGEFVLIVSCANVPYDEPCEARTLSCGESFSGSSAGATPSSIGSPSCAAGSQKDVFFQFTALANVPYSVTVNGDTYDGVLAAYSGSCGGVLTELDCSDSGFSSGIAETVDILVPTEQVIIIQTYDYATNGQSDFTITLNCPIPDNDNCEDAITLSVNNPGSCPANQVEGTTYGATSSSPDACEPDSPDVYYTFNSGNNSEVIINLNNISATDLVLSVFEASCGATAFYCNASNNQSPQISVTPFTTYYVRVHSLLASWTGTFNICIEKVAPEIATINGTISGWNSNCATRSVVVSMSNTTTFAIYTATTTLSTSGTFVINSIDIPAGTYDVLVKVQGALAVLSQDVVLSAGSNSLTTGPVVLGDINNNNVINVLDLSVFSASFLTTAGSPGYNFLADLNCDGVINIFDVSILGAGFNQTGDILPLP